MLVIFECPIVQARLGYTRIYAKTSRCDIFSKLPCVNVE